MPTYFLAPNTEVISSLVACYTSGSPTVIYGNAASGKTTSCLLTAIEAARNKGRAIYVDTEGGFNSDRLKQLTSGFDNVLDNIFLFHPKSFDEQHETIMNLTGLCENEKIKLVVIDTLGNHFRVAVNKDPKLTNGMMALQVQCLIRIARDLNKIVLVTTQARSNVTVKDEIAMVGGKLVGNMAKCIIELNKKDDRRFASLIKYKMEKDNVTHYNLGKCVEFEIKENGLFLK